MLATRAQGPHDLGMRLPGLLIAGVLFVASAAAAQTQPVTKYVRYSVGSIASFGILEGDAIRELRGVGVLRNPVVVQ